MITYQQARNDHEYLWNTHAPADDMTGGYVDSEDLNRLLKNPTKAMARRCYVNQIWYWFQKGPDEALDIGDWRNDPVVAEIAERYNCTLPEKWGRDALLKSPVSR